MKGISRSFIDFNWTAGAAAALKCTLVGALLSGCGPMMRGPNGGGRLHRTQDGATVNLTTPKGLRVVFRSQPALPSGGDTKDGDTTPAGSRGAGTPQAGTLQLWVEAGSVDDPPGMGGMAFLTQQLVHRSWASSAGGRWLPQLLQNGGTLRAFTSLEYSVFEIAGPKAVLASGLRFLLRALAQPKVSAHFVSQRRALRQQARSWLASASGASRIVRRLYAATFGQHDYARPPSGADESLARIREADVIRFHRSRYSLPAMALIAVGQIDRPAILAQVRRASSTLRRDHPATDSRSPRTQRRPFHPGRMRIVAARSDAAQAQVGLAFLLPSLREPTARLLGKVATTVRQRRTHITGGQNESAGDTYLWQGQAATLLVMYFSSPPEQTPERLHAALAQLGHLAGRLSSRSLRSHPIALSTPDVPDVARSYTASELGYRTLFFGRGRAQREEEPAPSVAPDLRRYLSPNNLTVVVLTPYLDPNLTQDLRLATTRACPRSCIPQL